MTGGELPILAVAAGGLVGFSLGTTGSGGSLMAIPLLVYVLGTTAQEAASLSLALVAAAACIGAIESFQSGLVKMKAALLLSGTGMIGGWVGVAGHRFVREEITLLLFGLLMIVAAGQMWWRTTLREDPQERSICADLFPRACWVKVSGIGLVVGLLTGFFGVGGGFVIVPALTLWLGFPMRVAVGTSLLIVTLIALAGVAAHVRLAPLDLRLLSFLIAGAVIGMLAGRQVSRTLSPTRLTRAFAVVAWAVAVILIGHNLWKINGGMS
ncbi:MAG: sulfite exporter TauE/SafE family protein [Nitrospirota bacterium]|nr:sulfite exporter TauE/SafE family protein [Nitrospirota bacterium]MDP3598666.1 sulfite exporter TauE/SafE family protein [Nitrospirota bacterium]